MKSRDSAKCLVSHQNKTTMASLQMLLITCLLLASTVKLNGLQQRTSFLSASVGDNIMLGCVSKETSDIAAKLFWYKQSLGMNPELMSSFFSYDMKSEFHGDFRSSKRFKLDNNNGRNDLYISDTGVSDSAVYYCVHSFVHQTYFMEGVSVVVKSQDMRAEVQQSPHEDTEEGQSLTLKCSFQTGSCGGRHTVHWFKQSEESAPGVLYSHGGGDSDQCGREPGSPTNSCVSSLPIHNVSSEQTGSYYCAVAACGQVLFGNGTRVEIKDGSVVYEVLSGATAFTTSLVVGLTFCLCMKNKTGASKRYTPAKIKAFPKLLQYVASEQVTKEGRGQRDGTWSECIYFSVEQSD